MIRAEGLMHRYAQGARLALPDFALGRGEVLLVRGASGSGKSTLLALLAGLATASAGVLRVGQVEPARLSAPARDAWRARCIGFVPQRLHLIDALSVYDNLRLPFYAAGRRARPQRLDELARALGLHELLTRPAHQLSVGQAQRVALARALVGAPEVLLVDEPTASLDDAQAQTVCAVLAELAHQQGATLVLTTHDRRVVEALANRSPRHVLLGSPQAHPETLAPSTLGPCGKPAWLESEEPS